jgi:uncharacterized membrane protein
MAIRRLSVLEGLMSSNNRVGLSSVDQEFSKHPFITLLHIIPGALFMILGPLQFMPFIRVRYIKFHRWSGRVFIMAAYTIGLSSIILSFAKRPLGGLNEAVASIFFSVFFLVCISLSFRSVLRRQIRLHREWMIRAFSIGLAISTVRIITIFVFVFFKMPLQDFLGTAFWLGFTMHGIAAELWINFTRKLPISQAKNVFASS